MSSSLLAARLVLAAVFAVAGVAKLLDLRGARAALTGFGVPERVAQPASVLLPLAELATAAALLPAASARFAAIVAATLLIAFVLGIGRSIARGEAPDCHCFGQLHSTPAGWRTLARNLLLAAAAGFVAIGGWRNAGPDVLAWIGRLNEAETVAFVGGIALTLVTAAGAAFMAALLRQQGRLLLRLDQLEQHLAARGMPLPDEPDEPEYGLPIGAEAPEFTLSGLYGESVTLEALRSADQPVMLIFTDPACGPCTALLPEVARWQRELANELTVAVITRGTADDNRAKIREHAITGVWLDPDLMVYEAYEAPGTPAAVIVDPQGRVASPVAAGVEAITRLVAEAEGRPFPVLQSQPPAAPQPSPPGLPLGSEAPDIELTDVKGERVVLTAEDRDTMLLFWDPACGFCQRMLDELRAWEASQQQDAPRLVLISRGSVEENEAMGLRAPIVLDGKLETNTMFGSMATPSAQLIDSDGRVASELALGVSAVITLASGGRVGGPRR